MGCQVFLHERNCPYATKSLRLKATQSINISNLVKLSEFVAEYHSPVLLFGSYHFWFLIARKGAFIKLFLCDEVTKTQSCTSKIPIYRKSKEKLS